MKENSIEEAKKYCKQIKDKDLWKIGYVYGREAIETVLSELEKKEAIINEMAKFIAGLDIDELICKDREHCTGDYEYETCEECIKEYFEKKEGKNNDKKSR